MTQREKLIELLKEALENHDCGDCESFNECEECGAQCDADYLITHGVVVSVRCKDCKYSNTDHAISDKRTWCDYWGVDPDFDDFCSYGERKGGE